MCGIAGIFAPGGMAGGDLERGLRVMNALQAHRGPDGEGVWAAPGGRGGFAHRRLAIIDLSEAAAQPMTGPCGNTVCFNGEIYNYLELREELSDYAFRTRSDTEVILAAYVRWGTKCVDRLRGMFAFAVWDAKAGTLFCARDRFGIKPFCYAVVGDRFLFASEAKALLPFLPDVATDPAALKEYLVFQFCLGGRTLFKGIHELPPAHTLLLTPSGDLRIDRYWEVYYGLDFDHTPKYFAERLRELLSESARYHLRSDVPMGTYLSGGVDSCIVAGLLAKEHSGEPLVAFHGKFREAGYDESAYARKAAGKHGLELEEVEITSGDFERTIRRIVRHLDWPLAGPGSFPQFHVSALAARRRKVVLGGQGGDEIFGGYVRYLIAYFEQCIKGAIDGTLRSGNFIVTYESIIQNLGMLKSYKPLLKEFWREGLFDDIDRRYFRLINRAGTLDREVRWRELPSDHSPLEAFRGIFNGRNVGKESYFDKMTHFDFKTLLPALLHVEDRVSMAHGLESRVPLLDHPLVEFAATMPADVKFKDGALKRVLIDAMRDELPREILERKDKMGFPVPLSEWIRGDLSVFVHDLFGSKAAKGRAFLDSDAIISGFDREPAFGRKAWGLVCLELWMEEFHDKASAYRGALSTGEVPK